MGNGAWGYVIEGYPRTLAQAEEVENQVLLVSNLPASFALFSLADWTSLF